MNIAVNTRLLVKDKFCGISWFAYESLKRITQNHPEHEFLFIFDRPYNEEFIFSSNVTPIVAGPPTRHPFFWYWWFEFTVPKILKKYKPDLFLSPDGYLPLKSSVKSLAMIPDINFEHYPEHHSFWVRNYYRKYFPQFAKKSSRIATVSQHSKDDISKTYNIPSSKIDVVYDGSNEAFKPMAEDQKKLIREKYTQGNDFFITVSALHPRKNIHRLFSAFDSFKQTTQAPIKLVIVGKKIWRTKEMKEAYDKMKFGDDVIFTGRIALENLKSLMGSAMALVYLSYVEGFGKPIVEAMNCDVPVMTVNSTSIPEIAGDAALIVDAFSADAIKQGLLTMYNDASLRNKLIEKGRKQRKVFSWDITADNMWLSIEKTLKEEINN